MEGFFAAEVAVNERVVVEAELVQDGGAAGRGRSRDRRRRITDVVAGAWNAARFEAAAGEEQARRHGGCGRGRCPF